MDIKPIKETDIQKITELAYDCFINDPFYVSIKPNNDERRIFLNQIFSESILICLEYGVAYYYEIDQIPIAFALWFDYNKLKKQKPSSYNHIFPSDQKDLLLSEKILKEQQFIDSLLKENTNYLYLLSIGVLSNYRRRGIASDLVSILQNAFPQYNLITDLSNKESIALYKRLGFEILGEKADCTFLRYLSPCNKYHLSKDDVIHLAIPPEFQINDFFNRNVSYKEIEIPYLQNALFSFTQGLYQKTKAKIIDITYEELIKYQRFIDLNRHIEIIKEEKNQLILFYVIIDKNKIRDLNTIPFISSPLSKKQESDITPDIYISIPICYNDIQKLEEKHSKSNNFTVNQILYALDFRSHYEAGIPIKELDNRNFKNRISRYYLGNIIIQLQPEEIISFAGNLHSNNIYIGNPVEISIVVSIDKMTNSGVLHLISFSCGLLITQLLDSISRNQLNIQTPLQLKNLYQYLKEEFNIEKKGSAKSFLSIPCDRKDIGNDMLASMLFCETHYMQDEELGTIIDPFIEKKLASNYGIAQYNYASVFAHTNIAIQLSNTLAGTILERITKESVTLFYIELILFEEASIHIANDQIINFLSRLEKYTPSSVLQNINFIISNYVRTIEFWDIQMNYPSSKESINHLREAFNIEKEQALIERNKSQLLTIYQTRRDIIDRKEASILSTIGVILAGISSVEAINNCGDNLILYIVIFLVIIILYLKRYILSKGIKFP